MSRHHSHQTAAKARAVAAKSNDEAGLRKMELTFLMTATIVISATVELIVGFHLR